MGKKSLLRAIVVLACCGALVTASCGNYEKDSSSASSSLAPSQIETKTSALTPSYEEDDDFATTPSSTSTSSQNTNIAALFAEIASIAGTAKSVAGYISAVAGAISAAQTLLTLVGLLHPDDEVKDLTADFNAVGLGLSVQIATSYVDTNYTLVGGALDALADEPSTVYAGSNADTDSRNGVYGLEQSSAWFRTAIGQTNDSGTDGPPLSFPTYVPPTTTYYPTSLLWKSVVPGRNMTSGSTAVFDWRLGAPALLNAIAGRLLIMNQIDPNFTTDHAFDTEITQQYNALLAYYQTMLAGVQCSSQSFVYFQANNYSYSNFGGPYAGEVYQTTVYGCNIVCADIYTATASLSSLTPPTPAGYGEPWPNATYTPNGGRVLETDTSTQCQNVSSTSGYAHAQEVSMQFVESKMPLFEMRSQIDVLYRILHPGWDLTQYWGQFEPQTASQRLCVDFVGESATQGTQLNLQPCNGGNSQWWAYNRQTGQIENPPTGLCMDVQWDNPLPGAIVWGWPCTQPQGTPAQITNLAQEWTYDPLQMHLQNANGVVLSASGIVEPFPGAVLQTASLTPQGSLLAPFYYNMQAWHADTSADPFP